MTFIKRDSNSGRITEVSSRKNASGSVEVVRGSNGEKFVLVDKGAARSALAKAGQNILSPKTYSGKK